jgi:hypothetical protein
VRQVDTFQSAFVLAASILLERLVRSTLTPNDEILGSESRSWVKENHILAMDHVENEGNNQHYRGSGISPSSGRSS